jgi:hypothetical protein
LAVGEVSAQGIAQRAGTLREVAGPHGGGQHRDIRHVRRPALVSRLPGTEVEGPILEYRPAQRSAELIALEGGLQRAEGPGVQPVVAQEVEQVPCIADLAWTRQRLAKANRARPNEAALGWVDFQTMRRAHSTFWNGIHDDPKLVADQLGIPKSLKSWSGRPGSNRRRPAWEIDRRLTIKNLASTGLIADDPKLLNLRGTISAVR